MDQGEPVVRRAVARAAAGLVGAIGFVIVSAFCTLRALRRLIGYEDVG